MDNGTTPRPPLTGFLLRITQLELVTPTTVAGTFYGIAFSLFCLYVHALSPRLRGGERTRQAKIMLVHSSIVMLCGLYNLLANAWVTQDAYIKHSDFPQGPYAYILFSGLHTAPVIAAGLACQTVIDVFTLAIQVWRVWVIWGATRYANFVTVLPTLGFLTATGLKLRTVILNCTLTHAESNAQDAITNKVETILQGTTSLLCTVLISAYLIFKQWQQRKLIGRSQGATGYMSVVAMIVESYLIESMWLMIIIIIWNTGANNFFGETAVYIETIAYLLVLCRVARGKSYESKREQPSRRNMSSLRWNHSNHAATQFRGIGDTQDSHYVSPLPEASNDARVSSVA